MNFQELFGEARASIRKGHLRMKPLNRHPGTSCAQHAVQCQLGEGLQPTYEPMVPEPLPSDLLRIIDGLEARRPLSPEAAHGLWERLRKRFG